MRRCYCAPGNGGISRDAACFPVNAMDKEGMLALAQEQQVDLVFVAPDDPLAAGMVDFLEAAGIPCFGPNAAAAQIEASKVFSKDLMKKYGIPTAGYEVFADPAAALEYIKAQGKYPAVIKADGLALGKGVVIAQNEEEAKAALHSIMEDKIFGESGAHVVVEEFLTGPEVSVLAFTDGKAIVPHGVLYGPQARLRRGQRPQHRRHGHHQPQPLLHPGGGPAVHGADFPAHHGRHERRGPAL